MSTSTANMEVAVVDKTEIPRRLLVLDDENDVAATICMMAAAADYDTAHIDDADIFLEKVISWTPTYVAVDLRLADRDGIEVIRKLAEMECKAAVIIMSGLGGRILESSARAVSENGLRLLGTLSKPFSRAQLLELLATDTHETHSIRRSPTPPVSHEQISDALKASAFIAHFQPKISCLTGELVGFECLARWPQQNGTMVPPDQFIGLAEQTGLIDMLTRQVYDYALANLPLRNHASPLKYALNLSPINLKDTNFPHWLRNKCREHSVKPSQIILEVTETASMDNPLALLEHLTQFRIHGFQLSIDDFGVGYSSLVQLARLPFSELKVDQMFVKTLSRSQESRKIVTAVVGLGKSMGLNVVAEGVEEASALGLLRELECDEAQGYFIGRPMAPVAIKDWNGVPQKWTC
ncbi:EAL domain-containing protein [Synechocystis sp. CS-94]|uniref:EAL domain-containing response regulator n=1 Tax=Synechocystis sp. CS-94 TaxID=2847986 RepID=UPI00056E6880|nr:EAL domain-containing response regulator [Synechocystis sp. CS-94]MCT0254048.1 EAL domain-containing response regulator [Synechocystis sp. CS-94]